MLSTSRNGRQSTDKSLSQTTQESIVETPITIKVNKNNKRLPKQTLDLSLMSNNKSLPVMRSSNESLSVSNGSAFKSNVICLQKSLNIKDKIDSTIDTNSEQEVEETGAENEVVIDSIAQIFHESVQDLVSNTDTLSHNNIDSIHEYNNSIFSSNENNNSSSIMSSINRSETFSEEYSNISEEYSQQLNDKNLSQTSVGSVSRTLTKQSIDF